MGENEQSIAKQAVRAGQPIPERIANAPGLHIGLELFFNAYVDLDSERQAGFGVGPIPWCSIAEYARAYDFDEETTEDLFFFVKRMDADSLKRLKGKK